ncbi:uncharacterized protein LOC132887378 [Neoarius graeffei]|uniref:uncharacterized protein LOC132887378 n=1 Tax=Neoarius graeffei TaxID=443677 RepID=UPI00298C1116|nr:uncharacterized protein LOC132887378 [Neoarius graeffei]
MKRCGVQKKNTSMKWKKKLWCTTGWRRDHKNNRVEFKMKSVLIAVFLYILSTSLQEECLGQFIPADIYNGGLRNVKENEEVRFKCKVDKMKENTIHMYLFKNDEKVRMNVLEPPNDDTVFFFPNVTVEHSGLYKCLYSKDKLNASQTNATGHNISLEVLGKILPAKINGSTTVKKEETLQLICTNRKIQNCTRVYVYLCLNGIRNKKQQVNCSNMTISTTFFLPNVSETNSGNYSCVYSVSNYNLNEGNNVGENTISVQVLERNHSNHLSTIISVSVAALVVLLGLLGFCWYRDIISFRLCQDPAVRSVPNSEPFYHEVMTDTFYMNDNGVLFSGEQPWESPGGDLVNGVNTSYSVQKHGGEQPVDNNMELNMEGVCYDSVKPPYAIVKRCKDKTGDEQVMQSFGCQTNVMYSMVEH